MINAEEKMVIPNVDLIFTELLKMFNNSSGFSPLYKTEGLLFPKVLGDQSCHVLVFPKRSESGPVSGSHFHALGVPLAIQRNGHKSALGCIQLILCSALVLVCGFMLFLFLFEF
jgi:hypothetical protein